MTDCIAAWHAEGSWGSKWSGQSLHTMHTPPAGSYKVKGTCRRNCTTISIHFVSVKSSSVGGSHEISLGLHADELLVQCYLSADGDCEPRYGVKWFLTQIYKIPEDDKERWKSQNIILKITGSFWPLKLSWIQMQSEVTKDNYIYFPYIWCCESKALSRFICVKIWSP